MAIKTVNTGIFKERQIVSAPDKREFKKISNWIKRRGSVEGQIDYCEKRASRIVRKYGIRNWPTAATVPDSDADLIAALEQHMEALRQNPDDVFLRDAGMVLCLVHSLRRAIAAGNAREAARHALQLGALGLKLEVRPHELPAKAGRAAPKNLAKGRKSKKDRHAKQHERHAQWIQKANQIADSFASKRSLAFYVAHHFGVNWETVYSVLKRKK